MIVGQKKSSASVLIIYFSLSGQSRGLINLFSAGLKDEGISVRIKQLKACEKISFPFKNIYHTFKMMLTTFFRLRIPIEPLEQYCFEPYDLIVIGGPTWSYNPSGPILSLLDRDGQALVSGQRVLPFISCRGYFRLHDVMLRKRLSTLGGELEESLIFSHPVPEPWSTIGVFLKSAGFQPEKMRVIRTHYPHFGHTTEQLQLARLRGRQTARALTAATVMPDAQSSLHSSIGVL